MIFGGGILRWKYLFGVFGIMDFDSDRIRIMRGRKNGY